MYKTRTIATAVAGAALALFGGVAAVRQQVPGAPLDADSLSNTLGLSAEAKARLAPEIDKLNALLERDRQAWQGRQELQTELRTLQQEIVGSLTPAQRHTFMVALRQAMGHGMGWGHMDAYMGAGYMGGGHMGGGHMGPGRMGGTGWMQGHAMGGAWMGRGFMGGGRIRGPGAMMGRGSRSGS